jgi:tetratricopeptide (TPR) repeat protein
VACNEFLDRYPDNENTPALLLLRGAAELRLPAGSTGGDSFARFLAKHPNHPATATALVGLGDTQLRQGDWPAAEEAYLRALAAGPDGVPLPEVYLHLGHAAEKQGKKDMARKYYEELVQNWGDTTAATQAKDRLETSLAVHAGLADAQALWNKERYAASLGVFPSLTDAEEAAKRFTAAGMRVHLLLQGKACELMVGEFDSEAAAALFAGELARRFQVQARPSRLP